MASRVISAVLQLQDQNFSSGLQQAGNNAADFQRRVRTVQNSVNNFASSADAALTSVAGVVGTVLTGAFTGLAVASAQTFVEMEQAFSRLQGQTGATGAELEQLQNTAVDVFNRGFGDSLIEVSDALALVKQNIHDIEADEFDEVTAKALQLAKITETEVHEVTRGAQNLIQQFGITSEEAFDLLTKGAQSGANASQDLFDQVAEFSAVAERAGYTADEFLGTLVKGSQNSVYQMDRVNNAILEFDNLASEGSKAVRDAFGLLNQDTQDLYKQFQAGEVTSKELSNAVIQNLKSMDNQTKANEIGATLWGGVWSDNTQDVMYALFDTTESLKDFEGASDAAVEAAEDGFGNRVKSAFREVTTQIAELGKTKEAQEILDAIATAAEDLVPDLVDIAERALDFAKIIKDNWTPITNIIVPLVAGLTAAKLAFVALKVIKPVVTLITALTKATTIATAAQVVWNAVMTANPIGLVATAIGILVAAGIFLYKNWDTVKSKTDAVFKSIGGLEGVISIVLGPLGFLINAAIDLAKNWDSTKSVWENVWSAILSSAETSVNAVIGVINGLIETINNIPGVNVPLIATVEFVEKNKPLSTSPRVEEQRTAREEAANFGAQYGRAPNLSTDLNSFDVGSNRIERDQIAEIHAGEMIIPARQAQKVREAGGTIDNIDSLVSEPVVASNSSTTNNGPTINLTVNANQLSYNDVVNRLSKDLKLAMANM